jgi:undecaprenyl-diphosphatase
MESLDTGRSLRHKASMDFRTLRSRFGALQTRAPVALPDDAAGTGSRHVMGVAGIMIATCLIVPVFLALDQRMAQIAKLVPPEFAKPFEQITLLGLSGYMLLGSAAIFGLAVWGRKHLERRRWRAGLDALAAQALYFFVVIAGSGLLAQLLKHMLGRARPGLVGTFGAAHFDVLSLKAVYASFPSGHTTTAFAAAVALLPLMPKYGRWLFAVAGIVGLSRILVGAHYPTDVVGGALLGAASAIYLRRYFAARRIGFAPRAGLPPRALAAIGPALKVSFIQLRAAVRSRLPNRP